MMISVIICAYTEARWGDLVAAVQGIKAQSTPAAELIIVIDHNPVLLKRAQAEFEGATVIPNEQQRGLSGARNSGIVRAHGEIVAFIDEDAIPDPDWLARLATHFTNQMVIGAGGAIRPLWLTERPKWFPNEFGWVVGCTYTGMPTHVADVRNLIGCNMAFRRVAFAEVGVFVDGIGRVGTRPLGCEETELCIRIRQKMPAMRFVFDPTASVDHRVPGVRARLRYFVERCYAEGLSKALISRYVGRQDALSSERDYTLKTLPLGVWRGVRDALTGDVWGLGRAGAIILGFACTVLGYVAGTASFIRKTARAAI
jgi:glycosyltransferase involved in cell wall biosynthesis